MRTLSADWGKTDAESEAKGKAWVIFDALMGDMHVIDIAESVIIIKKR